MIIQLEIWEAINQRKVGGRRNCSKRVFHKPWEVGSNSAFVLEYFEQGKDAGGELA
jgi:hypothetical protein